VNVFALLSTAEIIPWNGIARALVASVVVFGAGELVVFGAGEFIVFGAGDDFAFGDAEASGLGVGVAAFLEAAFAVNGRQQARAAAPQITR
jgi:hypothetical protein